MLILRVFILFLPIFSLSASADVFESSRKKCEKLSDQHRWIELTDSKDQSIAGFCELEKVKDGPSLEPHIHSDKIKVQGYFKKGLMHGEWQRFYSNGKPKDEGVWYEGTPEGEWSFWHEDGSLKERGRFFKGTKVCTWTKWDESGKKSVDELPGPNGGSCSKLVITTNNFSVFSMYQFQSSSQYLITGGLGWEPSIKLSSFPLYFKLGISGFLNRASGSTYFLSTEALGKLGYTFLRKINLEFGMGMQFWIGITDANSKVSQLRVGYLMNFWKINEIWASIGDFYFPSDSQKTTQIRLGVSIKI